MAAASFRPTPTGFFPLNFDVRAIEEDRLAVRNFPPDLLSRLTTNTPHTELPDGSCLNYPVFAKFVHSDEAAKATKCEDEGIGPPVYLVRQVGNFSHDGDPRYQMISLCAGKTAIDVLSKPGTWLERIYTVMYRVAERVATLHTFSYHGDLKGDNVLITEHPHDPTGRGDDVVVIDFGRSMGTPEYSSPERLTDQIDDIDRPTTAEALRMADVYSLGIMVLTHFSEQFPLMSGTRPYTRDSLIETKELRDSREHVRDHVRRCVPRGVPHEKRLLQLLNRSLSPNPYERGPAQVFAATFFTFLPRDGQARMRELGWVPSSIDALVAYDAEASASTSL